MLFIGGKDYGFTQLIAPLDFKTVRHEVLQDFFDGIPVKEPFVKGGSGNMRGHFFGFEEFKGIAVHVVAGVAVRPSSMASK